MTDLIAGMDEVGWGSLAGPLVIAVTAFPQGMMRIAGVRDSKSMTRSKMENLVPEILESASFFGFGFASAMKINEVGPAEAWQIAASMALEGAPEFLKLVVDGDRPVASHMGVQDTLVKADATVWQVSTAGIVAKVWRDHEMIELGDYWPYYDWASNVGYGSPVHREAIVHYGPCPHHRTKYIRKLVQ